MSTDQLSTIPLIRPIVHGGEIGGAISTNLASLESPSGRHELSSWSRWSAYTVVVAAAIAILAVAWARDRGLDLTDEGYYLQLYAHPEAAPPNAGASQYYLLVDLLTGPFELGIGGYRTMGLVMLMSAAALLALAVYRFVARWFPEYEPSMPPRPVGISLIMLAGLLGYTWAPLTVSYNTLAAVLVQLIMASILWSLGSSGDADGSAPVLYAGLGGALVVGLPDGVDDEKAPQQQERGAQYLDQDHGVIPPSPG